MDQRFRLRVVRGDSEFEAEGDRDFVLEMLDRFESSGTPRKTGPRPRAKEEQEPSELTTETGKTLSAREFIQHIGVKRHVEIVLAFGYYLEKYMGKPDFTPADINNLYYEAKMETSNTSQAIANNIKRGHMMEARGEKKGSKKRYVLTQSGESQVERKVTKKQDE